MEEQTFLSDAAATVTSTRIVINGKTFATRNVGSVAMHTKPPSRVIGVFILLIGGVLLLAQNWTWGVGFLGVGVLVLWSQKPTYSLMMMAGGGEVLALASQDGPRVQQVHDAVAQAISTR